jgi:glycosyltransferase involved in cell wall biosynthesis
VLRHHVRFIAATSPYYLQFVKRWYLRENALLIAGKCFSVIGNSAPARGGAPRTGFSRPDRVQFMTLGRMDWQGANQKGFDDILLALLHLSPELRRRVHLTIIGKGSERARLMRVAGRIEDAHVEFIESLPNSAVRERLRDVDCVILASRYEGMSVFALEALGFACPVIYSNAGGIVDLVDGNGFVYAAGDSQELAARMTRFIEMEDDELRAMSVRSLQIAARYTPLVAAGRLLELSRLISE